ncbi:MAG: hypothetical protein ACK4UN_05885 [Limisphaerales bacterium]
MKPSDLFEMWAPPESIWSVWAKPVLFAELKIIHKPPTFDLPWPEIQFNSTPGTAIVVDLPGVDSIDTGLALAAKGFRPVPLYNSSCGPFDLPQDFRLSGASLVNMEPIQRKLVDNAERIAALHLPPTAPPVFLLDSNRKGNLPPTPGKFDNRSVVFPQDFPSANFLLSHGIRQVLLLQKNGRNRPESDLAHVLLRWQEAGIQLFLFDSTVHLEAQPLKVAKPSNFRALWHRALAMLGLRRNSAGGFGSLIPEMSEGSGYG